MDYYSLPRKQLQALCKKHGIPANSTNVSMADALTVLLNGDGKIKVFDEGFQKQEPVSQDRGDDSVLTEVSNTPRRDKRSKRSVIAEEDESAEVPVVIEIEETPVAPKGKGAKSANKTRERRPRTRGRSGNVLEVDIVNIDGSLHSSEVDESSDAVTALNSAKVERNGPVKGSRNARTPMTKSCRRTDENEDLEQLEDRQGSYEKEGKTDETNGKLIEEAPKTRTKGRSFGNKVDKVEVEEAIEDSSTQGENVLSKKEITPICRRSTRARASKVVDTHPLQNISSSIKKTGNAESIKKTDGSLHSSEIYESSDAVTALNSGKVERSGPVKGSRNSRTPLTKSCCRTDENEDLERLEDTQWSDEKEEKTDETNDKLVEKAPKTRTKGRSSGKKVDKVEVEEAIEGSSSQEGENDGSKKEMTSICRRSTRARASKAVDTRPLQNRSLSIKKAGNSEFIRKTPATVSKARRVKLSPMTENLTDNEEEGDQAEEVFKVPSKKNLLAKLKSSSNNDVKSPVRTRRALRSSQKDSTGILDKDALEESASKVKRMLTRRGRNSVRNAHQVTGSETQEESNSEQEGSDVKQERESYRKITRKAVIKDLGKDEHKHTEEIDVPQADLNVKEEVVIENKAPEDVEAIDETESEEMKCEITLQPELNMCQIFDQKHVSFDISQIESSDQVETKSIAEISSRSSNDHQSTPISESYGSRIMKELNVYSGEVTMEQGIASAGMTPLSRPVEGKFNSLPSGDQLGALKIQDTSCLKCLTDSIVAGETPIKKDAFTSSVEARVGELIGIDDGEVGEKIVNDGVTVAESHNASRSVTMRVDLEGEEDAPFSHISDSLKIEENKEILHHNDHKTNIFNIQELQCDRDLSSSSAEAASPVEEKEDISHSESNHSSIEATQNLFEVQEKVVNDEPGNVAVLAVKTSGEECLDPKAVYSSDLKIAGEQTELQLIPTNLVEETNRNRTETNLQDTSFLIEEVSDLEGTEEINQDAQDSDFSFEVVSDNSQVRDREVTGFANAEGQVLAASEKVETGEDCQDVEEKILSDLDNTEEENPDVQDSDLSSEAVSDIFQVQGREVTGFANAEGQVLEASEKIESGEDCQDVEEEILSDLDNTEEENLDVQDSDLSFKVVSDISQVQDRQITGFANAEGQVLEASEKIESGEDCQDIKKEILSELNNSEEENLDVQDSDLSVKVVSDISQVQDRQVTGFANAEGQVFKASEKIDSGEDCQDVKEEILSDLDNTEEENLDVQDSDLSFKVVSDISLVQDRQVTGFATAEGQVPKGSEKIESGEDCQDVKEEILSDLDNTEVENQDDHSLKVVPNILQVTGFANVESQDLEASNKVENGGACRDTEEGKLPTLTSLPEETKDSAMEGKLDIGNTVLPTKHSFEEEFTGLGIAKQDEEACNDTVEGKHPFQSSLSDNASEADPVKRATASSIQAVAEVEIGNFSFELDGRQKEAYQAQGCISDQRIQDSDVHPQACSNTSCFAAEVLVHSNVEDCVIAIQNHGTSDDDRTTIDKCRGGKLDVFNENSASRSDSVPLLCTKEETNFQNQISDKQVSPTADLDISVASACQSVHSIDCLESDTMAIMKSFETGNGRKKLGVEDTSVFPVEKYSSAIATKGSEQTNVKMPIIVEDACYVNTLCEKINYMSLDGASQELAASDSHLALMKPYPVERDSRQQREMLTDLTDQSRKDGQNTILDNGFQIVPLESAGCELQIGKKNPHDLNDLSIRKLRALLKEKNMPRNNGRKERERVVLRDLTSIELEERKKVSDNTRL